MEKLNLQLVLKRPKDKPPFLGVLFDSEFKASRYNEWWIQNPGEATRIGLMIEPKRGVLEIKIVPAYANGSVYRIEDFKPFELQQFLIYAMSQKVVNFGHVIIKENKHIPVRTNNGKLWVLKISNIEFIKEH